MEVISMKQKKKKNRGRQMELFTSLTPFLMAVAFDRFWK
jgi:hypothetical protein